MIDDFGEVMRAKYFSLYMVLLLGVLFQAPLVQQKGLHFLQEKKPAFPFDVLDEVVTSEAYPVSKARIFLESRYYSRDNIERIFEWYSQEHRRKGELVSIFIFTDMENLIADRNFEISEANKVLKLIKPDAVISETQAKVVHRNAPLYDAFFRRTVDYANGASEINERYTYSPDLNSPAITKTIVLKGRDPFEVKR